MRLLLVEDDHQIAEFILKGFREAGYAVDHAQDGEEGLHLMQMVRYDAAVVDIMLPRLDGISLLQLLRNRGQQLPILILSAKQTADERVDALQRGADDYLVKPFLFAELLARIQALLRRSSGTTETTRLGCADLRMDLVRREVFRGGQRLELQPREFALLEYLLRNAGKILSKTMILEQVWDFRFDPQTNVVDVLVCRLRNKVDRDFPVKLIHTLRGIGYVLKAPEE
ncbi:DNA-binding response regulator [Desulfuromonas versatilis]|uniref:DNA-binding response regulator n=1 Tax=Desulfuromonas versatilis TaxID=2802975 RepID=A0ABM8HXQ0_9BACT|nr:response regulator transcription factor [Desulfuromonas versatilis]BCR06740.1 DNA-binding response regulator [Desulfuromonas versatilis]